MKIYEKYLNEGVLNEGYEKVVLGILDDVGIEGSFSYGVLFVAQSDYKKAIKVLKDNMNQRPGDRDIVSMPHINAYND